MLSRDIITEAFNQGSKMQDSKIVSWPRNMYILGGIGVVLGSVVIMASDIIKNLPKEPFVFDDKAQTTLKSASGKRDNDLDGLIQKLELLLNDDRPESPSYITAKQAADAASQAAASNNPAQSSVPTGTTTTRSSASTTSPATSTTKTVPNPTPTPTPTPAPTPKPAPVCTTSPSGVTTCN